MKDIIFETRVGSHLYGLNNKNSDEDFLGIIMPSINNMYGFGNKDYNVDLSFISKTENGKNDKDAIDRKMISLHGFFKLIMRGAPNAIEILYSGEDSIVKTSEIWERIIENREIFINSSWVSGFLGFSRRQKLKLMNTPQKRKSLEKAIAFLEKIERRKDPLIQFEKMEGFEDIFLLVDKNGNMVYEIKNLPFRVIRTNTVAKTIKNLKNKITVSNRDDIIIKYGYDCKSASHLIRLLLECLEVIKEKKIVFPFSETDKKMLLDIKGGEWSLDDVLRLADDLEFEISCAIKKSPLPILDRDKCENLLVDIMTKYF